MKRRNWMYVVLVFLLLLSLTGCGTNSAGESDNYYAESPKAEAADGVVSEMETGTESDPMPQNRKLIRTIRMDAETEELDVLLTTLDGKIAQLGGYVENREVYNGSAYAQRRYRNANLTIRIPVDQADAFVSHISGLSNVVSSNESVEDITLQYVDTESRVAALETEQDRLLELMEKAETLEDLLTIESRLTDVRYELERYASQLRTYDNLVDYATIHLSISEVQEYTPVEEKNFFQRIGNGFLSSLKGVGQGLLDFVEWLIITLPYLVVYAAIGTGIVLLVRKLRRNKKRRNLAPKPNEKTE